MFSETYLPHAITLLYAFRVVDFNNICGIGNGDSKRTAIEDSSKTHSAKDGNKMASVLRKVFPCATSKRKRVKPQSPLHGVITSDHGITSSPSHLSAHTYVDNLENTTTPLLQQHKSVKVDIPQCNTERNSIENDKLKFFTSCFKQNVLWLPMFSVLICPPRYK